MLIRILAITITVILMVLSVVLNGTFSRLMYLLPCALVISLILTLMWLGIPASRRNQLWHQLVSRWRFPRSLILVTSWTLLLTLVPVCSVGHFPRLKVHDEFSYLLGAETFVHGRLTNPPPACWEHFESFHIMLSPTYQTKYQPGMSLMLALGLWLTKEAYVGVIIAFVLGSNALAWMLHLWLPRRWALPMTLLGVVIMLGVWGNNYFVAGPLATFSGAIQLALLRRFLQADRFAFRWVDGVLWGLSLVVLAWTRPFEGLLFSVLMGGAMGFCILRQKQLGKWLIRVLPGMALILLPAVWFQARYNLALTGSATTFPYFMHDQLYFISPPFLFQSPFPEPMYRHEVIRQFHQSMADWYQQMRTPAMLPSVVCFRFGVAWVHYGFLMWLLPMIVLPELGARQETRWLLLLWVIFLLIIQVVTWFLPHYAAPAWPAWWIVIAASVRILRRWTWQGKKAGQFIVCLFIATTCCYVVLERLVIPIIFDDDWMKQKTQIASQLLSQDPRHLVLVQYAADHNTGEEWVYNGADIAAEPIIWARSMDQEKDRELIKHYPGRAVWLLKVNTKNPKQPVELLPYVPEPDHASPPPRK